MSAKLNEFKLMGVFSGPPRTKETRNGAFLCRRLIAVPRGWNNPETGVYEESMDEFDLCAWAMPAEVMADLPEGVRVLVSGKLKMEQWVDNGDIRRSMRLAVDSVQQVCEVVE